LQCHQPLIVELTEAYLFNNRSVVDCDKGQACLLGNATSLDLTVANSNRHMQNGTQVVYHSILINIDLIQYCNKHVIGFYCNFMQEYWTTGRH